jgi:hypothetical protein
MEKSKSSILPRLPEKTPQIKSKSIAICSPSQGKKGGRQHSCKQKQKSAFLISFLNDFNTIGAKIWPLIAMFDENVGKNKNLQFCSTAMRDCATMIFALMAQR